LGTKPETYQRHRQINASLSSSLGFHFAPKKADCAANTRSHDTTLHTSGAATQCRLQHLHATSIMSGVYSVEDLLKLRASPLICKPPNLPAIEEFLSASEPVSKRATTRSKLDDGPSQSEGFPKRPLLDASQRKSTTGMDHVLSCMALLTIFQIPTA
jgi:hypothetical protein